jgi:ferredoxin
MTEHRKGLVKPSTRWLYEEGRRTEDYSFYDFLHGYLYGRWPYLYIGVATGEHPLNRFLKPLFFLLSSILDPDGNHQSAEDGDKFADGYHGKVVPLDQAKRLVSIQQDISIKNLEKVIPFTRAKDIILKNPQRIAVLDCPCRVSRPNPCTPLDVCIIVGDPFVSFILEHQPRKTRLITSSEALEILEAEHKRGHVQHAFFKDAMLNRFYAICNCCSCCCGAFQAHQNDSPMLMTSGYTAKIDRQTCEGCGNCVDGCQFSAIALTNGSAEIIEEACYGCGVCVTMCPESAIELVLDPSKGTPLVIQKLIEETKLVEEVT